MDQFIYPLTYGTSNPLIASEFWQLWIKLVFASVYRCWFGHTFSSFLGKYQGAWDGTGLVCKFFSTPSWHCICWCSINQTKACDWVRLRGGRWCGEMDLSSQWEEKQSHLMRQIICWEGKMFGQVCSLPCLCTHFLISQSAWIPSCWTVAHLTCRGNETKLLD